MRCWPHTASSVTQTPSGRALSGEEKFSHQAPKPSQKIPSLEKRAASKTLLPGRDESAHFPQGHTTTPDPIGGEHGSTSDSINFVMIFKSFYDFFFRLHTKQHSADIFARRLDNDWMSGQEKSFRERGSLALSRFDLIFYTLRQGCAICACTQV